MNVSARPAIFVVTLLSLAGLPTCLSAQAARPASTENKKITLDIAIDAKGAKSPEAGAGLQQQDFVVLDNKVQRTLSSFREIKAGQEPVRVVLLLDSVNITFRGLASARERVNEFLRSNGGHLSHPTAIAILTDKGLQMQGAYTTDGNVLADGLQKQDISLRTITRDTGIYGAEERFQISTLALRTLAEHVTGQPGRTVVLWVSPGWPLLSGPGLQLDNKQMKGIFGDIVNFSTRLREARLTLYAIDPLGAGEAVGATFRYEDFLKGTSKSSQVDLGDLSLQVLAVQSGGLALNSNDTAALLQRSFADLDDYYEISFEEPPAETPDTYHHLDVKVDKPGLVARTHEGYYAQP